MIEDTSRKEEHKNQLYTKSLALFAISLALFFGALTCFAWAAPTKLQQADQRESDSLMTTSAQEPAYTGKIASGSTSSSTQYESRTASSSSSTSSNAASSSASSTSKAISSTAPSAENASQAAPNSQNAIEQPAAPEAAYEQVEMYEEPSTQSFHTVHHNAYQSVPVYTTIHHQKSTAREIVSGGIAHIEWTVCPVCGEQHDSSFNERIVDHVNEVFCAACGGMHDSDYDEVVYE